MLGRKANQRRIFQGSAFHFQGFKASKGAISNSSLASSTWQEWGHYSWATALSFLITSVMEHWAARGSLQPSRKVCCQTKGIFWSGIFWAVPSAIALYMATFAFFLADAAFSFPSVLIVDGGKVLAVQKFMRCRKSEHCVLSSVTGCCCCSATHKREHSNVPFWMSSTAQLRSRWMVCKLKHGAVSVGANALLCSVYFWFVKTYKEN